MLVLVVMTKNEALNSRLILRLKLKNHTGRDQAIQIETGNIVSTDRPRLNKTGKY